MTPLETATGVVNQLIGKPCWYCFAGGSTGSRFDLLFGAKIPRAKPLRNPTVPEEARANEGEYALYVECPWRIEIRGVISSSWQESCEPDGPMCRGLDTLVGETVEHASVMEPALDLVVKFAGDKVLRLFCDTTYETYYLTNWSVFGPGDLFVSVGPCGQVRIDRNGPADQW